MEDKTRSRELAERADEVREKAEKLKHKLKGENKNDR